MTALHTKSEIGRLGEKFAARYLKKNGYRIVARNVHCGKNELDLIVKNRHVIAFVEVKARSFSSPEEAERDRPANAVDAGKRERTLAATRAYLREHPCRLCPRIDVIEVYLNREKRPKPFRIHHIEGAISAFGSVR